MFDFFKISGNIIRILKLLIMIESSSTITVSHIFNILMDILSWPWALSAFTGLELAGEGGGGLPCPFLEIENNCSNSAKKIALILEKYAFFVCIYELNFDLKCCFKSILEKKHQNFSLRNLSLCVAHETFIEVLPFQSLEPKDS